MQRQAVVEARFARCEGAHDGLFLGHIRQRLTAMQHIGFVVDVVVMPSALLVAGRPGHPHATAHQGECEFHPHGQSMDRSKGAGPVSN